MMLTNGAERAGPLEMRVEPSIFSPDYEVSFRLSMRELFHHHSVSMVNELLAQATASLGAGIKQYLESSAFQREIAQVAREELRPLLKQALIDRLDEIVEDVLA